MPQRAFAIEEYAERPIAAHPLEHVVDFIPFILAQIVLHRGNQRASARAGFALKVVDIGSGRADDAPVGVHSHYWRERQQQHESKTRADLHGVHYSVIRLAKALIARGFLSRNPVQSRGQRR